MLLRKLLPCLVVLIPLTNLHATEIDSLAITFFHSQLKNLTEIDDYADGNLRNLPFENPDSIIEIMSFLYDREKSLIERDHKDRTGEYFDLETYYFLQQLTDGNLDKKEIETLTELFFKGLNGNLPSASLGKIIETYVNRNPEFYLRLKLFYHYNFFDEDAMRKDLRGLLTSQPENLSANIFQAELDFSKEDLNSAIVYFTKSIQLFPEYSFAYAFRGHCYQDLNRIDEAREDFNIAIRLSQLFRAIRMDPGLEAQHLNLMRSQLKMFIENGILVKEARTILETILN